MNNKNIIIVNNRIESIDIAKGIGIFLVVFFHCKIGELYYNFHLLAYSFHMPLFFILAGMCFSTKYSFKEFTLRRVQRLLIPCFFFTLIHVAVLCLLHHNSIYRDVLVPLPEHIPGALWFLNVLFISEVLCFPIVVKINNNKIKIAIMIGIGVIGVIVSSINLNIPQSLGSVPLACFYIMLGNMVKPYLKYLVSLKFIVFVSLLVFWGLFTKVMHVDVHLYDGMSEPIGLSEISSILGVIMCLTFSTRLAGTRLGGGISLIGKKSLQIMVTHQIFLVSFMTIFWSNDFEHVETIIYSILQLAATVGGTYLSVLVIDKKMSWLIGVKK